MSEPIHFDTFRSECKYAMDFFECNHPEQDLTDGVNGICNPLGCPLAAALSHEEPDDCAIMQAAGFASTDEWTDEEWVLPHELQEEVQE